MPITLHQKDDTSLLEIDLAGKLTHEDYETLVPRVEAMVARHGRIRLLVDMTRFEGWSAHALWDETKLAAHHVANVSRIALVGEGNLGERMVTRLCRWFTKAQVRRFEQTEIATARTWLDTPSREQLRQAITAYRAPT
jgi:hypothetical protein